MKNLLMVGFEFLSHYFLSVNENQQKLIKAQKKEKKNASSVADNDNFNLSALYGFTFGPMPKGFYVNNKDKSKGIPEEKEKGPTFKLLRPPTELDQLDIVWNIALECENEKVVPKAINFLIKIYSCLDEELQGEKTHIQDNLIERCIGLLNETQASDEFRTKRIIEILKNVIYEAEKKGTGSV